MTDAMVTENGDDIVGSDVGAHKRVGPFYAIVIIT